jgi:hypothetical protein
MKQTPPLQPSKRKIQARKLSDSTSTPALGKVAATVPGETGKIVPADLRAPANVPGARKGPKLGKYG